MSAGGAHAPFTVANEPQRSFGAAVFGELVSSTDAVRARVMDAHHCFGAAMPSADRVAG